MKRLCGRSALPSSFVSAVLGVLGLYVCGACGGSSGGNEATRIVEAAEVGVDAPVNGGDDSGRDGPSDGSVVLGKDAAGGDGDATVDSPIEAGPDAALPPAVRFVGRSDDTDPAHPKFGWPGARIIARFTGTDVNVTLDEQSLFSGPSRWDVLVDGARSSTLAPANGMGTYAIAVGLANAVHTIELYKRTEGVVGVTQFMGYDFPNGGQLLSPPPTPNRRIELLGDSTTTGYGDECASAAEAFTGATENERLAYSGLVAHDLGADHHNTSYLGKGVLLNYKRSDTVVFESLFPRRMPGVAANDWVFASFTPDVVWMTLGGNDWDQESPATAAPNLAAFTSKYVALAALVRSKYPSAHVFCAIAPSLSDDYPVGWNVLTNMRTAMTDVVAARVAAGDTKIYKYEFTRAIYPTDLTGCGGHGNLGLHRKMADEAIAQIKAKTGWL